MNTKEEQILNSLPEHFAISPEIQTISRDVADNHIQLEEIIDDVSNQFYVDTATWGLPIWEEELEIIPERMDLYSRREQIKSELTNQSPTTFRSLEREVNRFLENGVSQVRMIPYEYAFNITVPLASIREWIPHKLLQKVEELKPAHLEALYIAIAERVKLIGRTATYNYPVHYPITNTFYVEPVKGIGVAYKAVIKDGSHTYPVYYPITGTFYCSE